MTTTRSIENAKSQLQSFGKIKVVYYQNRNYESGGNVITLLSIAEFLEFTQFALCKNDDYSVHHANFYK